MTLVVSLEALFKDESRLLAKHESWERVELGQVCKVLNGFAFKSTLFNKNDGVPVVRIRDLMRGRSETFYKGDYPREYVVKNGDLLVGMDGNFGCYEWNGGEALLNQRVCKLTPSKDFLDRKFLLFGINGYLKAIQEATSSVTVGHLSSRDVQRIPFPFPSLNEQHRIAAKLEKLLSCVDSAQARLATIPHILKRFRQSVLAAACSGRLTADWRTENANRSASSLLDKITKKRRELWAKHRKAKGLAARLTNYPEPAKPSDEFEFDVPETWETCSMDALTSVITSGSRDWKQYYKDDGSGTFIMAQNIRPKHFDSNYRLAVAPPENDRDRERSKVFKGDLLVTIVGANTGDSCRVPRELREHYVCQSVALMRPVLPSTSPFLEAFLNSTGHGLAQYTKWIYGEGRPHLSFDHLRETLVCLPPLAEQQEIVRRVEALFKTADAFEARYLKAKAHVDKLTQSILAKAFRGELVIQDENDEPASLLLERILAERDMQRARRKVLSIAEHETRRTKTPHTKGIFYRRAALDCYVLEKLAGDPHLGRTKIEKISHLLEHHCGIDLEREPIRDAAGPNDYPSRIRVESLARKQKWYSTRNRKGGKKIDYLPGPEIQKSRHTAINFLGDRKATVDALLLLLRPLDTKNVEVVATLYASWNDFLLGVKTPTDDELIHDVRNNWHPTKQLIPIEWWTKTLGWMRRKKLIPRGTGKSVTHTSLKQDSPVLPGRTRQTGTKSSQGTRKRRA